MFSRQEPPMARCGLAKVLWPDGIFDIDPAPAKAKYTHVHKTLLWNENENASSRRQSPEQ